MDTILATSLPTAVLRIIALFYYLIFGSLGDVAILTAWLLWIRRDVVFQVVEKYPETLRLVLALQVVALVVVIFASYTYLRHHSRAAKSPIRNNPSQLLHRSELFNTSISRHADKIEHQLESIFRRYLKHMVEQSTESLVVQYIPCGTAYEHTETMISSQAQTTPSPRKEMIFKVLTPAFYSRFVYYAHDFEAIFCELNENHTIWVSNPELLPKLIIKKQPPPLLQTTSYLDYGYFMAIKKLRQRPKRIEQPLNSTRTGAATHSQKDIRGFRLSAMDGYVLVHEDAKARHVYRTSVMKLFIADKIALGSVGILQFEHWVLKLIVAWVAMY